MWLGLGLELGGATLVVVLEATQAVRAARLGRGRVRALGVLGVGVGVGVGSELGLPRASAAERWGIASCCSAPGSRSWRPPLPPRPTRSGNRYAQIGSSSLVRVRLGVRVRVRVRVRVSVRVRVRV